MSGFDLLDPVIQHHIVNELGWGGLRPLQDAAVEPLIAGEDALLLAPTAGGKTEAAMFPLLTRMSTQSWTGTSVLYVCPLKALLNNLAPRIDSYARWLGRSARLRHGDTSQSARRRLVIDRPDVLLTTPESVESMLVSATIDPRALLNDVRAVVVDEVHAFAGDDRGWHLLALLERLTRLVGRPLQRVGLSATVGNADQLLTWLQGSNRPLGLAGDVIAPELVGSGAPVSTVDVALDYVGTVSNAATVISRLHRGEKRLVFADSRRIVEQLAVNLNDAQIRTFVSHSSLSVAERRRSEEAFANEQDCVIVSTSTLELGVDVGDLDRVLQVGAPSSVASFLQRLGRTGRRPGTRRNMTVLATDDKELLKATAVLLLWSEGFVEPVIPPPEPAHIGAQQIMALALQERYIGRNDWRDWLGGLPLLKPVDSDLVISHMLAEGVMDEDSGMLLVGPEAERRYGRRHFMEIMSVFTSDPQVTVAHGRDEIGTVDPLVLVKKVDGPRRLALGGRTWQVTSIDWSRRRAQVVLAEGAGLARWMGYASPLPFDLVDAMRRVLLGADPVGVQLSARAAERLAELRSSFADTVDRTRTVILRTSDSVDWWTWAGQRTNFVIAAALQSVAPQFLASDAKITDESIQLASACNSADLHLALSRAVEQFGDHLTGIEPDVSRRAVHDLKFSDLLPEPLAVRTLATRLADHKNVGAAIKREKVDRTHIEDI